MENQYLKNARKGDRVEVITENNRLCKGIIDDVLSRSSYQMYGIKVRLKTGEIGRIQKFLHHNDPDYNTDNEKNIRKITKKGEDYHTEYKSSALWSQNYTEEEIKKSRSLDVHYYRQKASRIILAKSIAAFLNSDGGILLIGIKEKKTNNESDIIGIQDEFRRLKDQNKDGYKRMIVDEIIRPYFPPKISNHLNTFIKIEFIELDQRTLCLISIKKSDSRVFLRINNQEIFVIRVECENRILEGEKLVDYCIRHW